MDSTARSWEPGAHGYILKDTPQDLLLEAIKVVKTKDRCFPADIASRLTERMARSNLTPREHQVVQLVAKGLTDKEIGRSFGISHTTARNHVNGIIEKLEVSDRSKAGNHRHAAGTGFTVTPGHGFRSDLMKTIRRLTVGFVVTMAVPAQPPSRPPNIVVSNDRLELTIQGTGGTFAKLLLREGDPLNPLATMGHFLALDGFGAPSEQERAAGMPFHGEASKQPVKVIASQSSSPARSTVFEIALPLAQETLTRTIELVDGENVVYVISDLQSGLAVDRPISWAEHATLGPPFLEKGKTVVDMPALSCRVRPYKPGGIPGRLVNERDFQWPMAPTKDAALADLRLVPDNNYLDLASCQIDPKRKLGFVTALNLDKRLLFGYVFRQADYPWLMSWMNYTGDGRAARGMEFSTQPFDISHQETVAMSPLFGTPTFRWLPAKAKIQTRFLIFYSRVPEGFSRIDDVVLEGGNLTVVDRSGKRLVLPASRGL